MKISTRASKYSGDEHSVSNQAYEVKKGTYYGDFFIIGEIITGLKPPENLSNYEFKSNEAKIFRLNYDVDSGRFLGLTETLIYMTVRGYKPETFLDYGYSKDSDKILFSTSKKEIPNSFSGTIFRDHKLTYEAGFLSGSKSSNMFFFLPSTMDRIKPNNRYNNYMAVRLWPVDIEPSNFGENFDPSKLDFENEDREKTRESLLRVLREVAVLSTQNLIKNPKCTLSKRQISDKDCLWSDNKKKKIESI